MCVNLSLLLLYLALASGKPSFTILLDTTQSMQEEIDVIKLNIESVVNYNNLSFENYILVPFNDPDVGPPLISPTSDNLVKYLNNVSVSGGNDCPENSLAGIKKALEVSNQESYIFLFSDAYANDDSKFNEIADLCRRTRSQVSIFLSGRCVSTGFKHAGSINVYYDITKACAGNVFQFDHINLRQAFSFMKELVQVEWSDVITHDSFTGYREFMFSVDSATTDFIIAVYGVHPALQIVNSEGKELRTENIVNTLHSKVVRIINPDDGEYKVNIRCQGPTSATFYKRNDFPFKYGFSTKLPRSMKETSLRPIPGWKNYILIEVPPTSDINIIELHSDGDRKRIYLDKSCKEKGIYLANALFEPLKPFKIYVSGHDLTSGHEIKAITRILEPQNTMKESQRTQVSLEIIEPETTIVDYETNVTVACKVMGYPKPTIWWEDDNGTTLISEEALLEIPDVHISYVTIDKLTTNITIYCKANNIRGEEARNIELFVKRTFSFNVIRTPEDETIEFGTTGKLYCQVEAYPIASINWYHNDSLIESSERIQLETENSMMVIKNMSQDDTGEYKCEMANEFERRTFTAVVSVSGLEAPEIGIQNTELVLKLGDWTDIECKIIKGRPTPDIAWRYKSYDDDNFGDVPDGVYVEDSKIKLPAVRMEHRGLYRCEAVNTVGQDYRDITVSVQYGPKIKNDLHETLTVKEGDMVELTCDVSAAPEASVLWQLIQNDVNAHLDNRHTTDFEHTHRFEALFKDSGIYHCIAENNVARAEKMVTVNVLVPPYIQTPASKSVTVNVGASVTLACNVLFGNPIPTIKWEFIAAQSPATVLNSRNTSSLHLTDISKAQEGTYMCLAENEIGSDIVRIYLKVQ